MRGVNFVVLPNVLSRNLVVVAPTGCGKTTAVLRNLDNYLNQFSRIFLAFPTKALMAEVASKLPEGSFLLDNSDARLSKNIDISDWLSSKIIISSYEKLDSMTLLHPALLSNALVVIDEVHLATDDDRAMAILSILASAKKFGARVIVMSATIPNYEELAEYLDAEVIRVDGETKKKITVIDIGYVPRGTVRYLAEIIPKIIDILKKDIDEYGGVLPTIIFRPSRKQCELIASELTEAGIPAKAYHAGIASKERHKIIEDFNSGKLPVIVSTHALCWGVNTPAQRVIIAGAIIYKPGSPEIMLKSIDVVQMAGRAGRPGHSKHNVTPEVVVITTSWSLLKCSDEYIEEKEFFERALNTDYMEKIGLRANPATIIVRLVHVKRVRTVEEIEKISKEWFNVPDERAFKVALELLVNLNLLKIQGDELKLTDIGMLVAEHYIDLKMYREIKNVILDNLRDLESRFDKLIAVAKVARALRPSTMTIPNEAIDDSVVLSVLDEDAREVIAQFSRVTGDTDPLAETMKNIAFFVNRVAKVLNCPSDDWWILGKTMKQIRSMIYNDVPIKGVLNMYIDGTIDKFFFIQSEN